MPIASVNGRDVLFIHIPKTGGMAISAFLGDHAEVRLEGKTTLGRRSVRARHFHAAVYERLFSAGDFDWCFTVVRHPVSKLVSEYTYQTRKTGMHVHNRMPFSVWLRYRLARERLFPGHRENHFRPQAEFPCFDCDVFRLEDGLDRVAEAFGRHCGLKDVAGIGRHNRSKRRSVAVEPRDVALIARRYAVDFERFDYDPDRF